MCVRMSRYVSNLHCIVAFPANYVMHDYDNLKYNLTGKFADVLVLIQEPAIACWPEFLVYGIGAIPQRLFLVRKKYGRQSQF